jgi:hypothetical protein
MQMQPTEPCPNQRADNTFTPGGRSKHRLLQSCHPPVEWPPLPCLTLKHAKTCDILRNMPKRLITASVQTISAQTTVVRWIGRCRRCTRRTSPNAMLLQTDRGLACRPMWCRRAAALQETVRSTSRARDRQNSPLVRSGHHLDQASARWARYRRNRNRRRAACRSSARHPSRSSPDGVCEYGVGPFPPATISRDRAINRISLEARKRPAALAELRNLSGRKGDIEARRNIAAVKDRGSVDRLPSPTRIRPTSLGSGSEGRLLGSTVSAHAVMSVRRPTGMHSADT